MNKMSIIIIILNRSMEQIRRVQKHFPITTSSNAGDFALKSIGQSWLQIHNSEHLIDVISLPSEMRMAKLYELTPDKKRDLINPEADDNDTTYIFNNDHQIWIGWANEHKTQLICNSLIIDGSILMTNGVRIRDSIYNITKQRSKQFYINSITCERDQELTHTQLRIECHLAQFTNLAQCDPLLYFVSNIEGQESLITYDLEKQAICSQCPLPSLRQPNNTKCQPVPTLNNTIWCHGTSYLSLVDTRADTVISLQQIYRSESAVCSNSTSSPCIYYSRHNIVNQYEPRKGRTRPQPILTHGQYITGLGDVGCGLIKVEDGVCGGMWLYGYV